MLRGSVKYIVAACLISLGARGHQGPTVDAELVLPIFLKIITYDENFEPGSIDTVDICTVYDRAVTRSYDQLRQIERYLADNSGLTIAGVAVRHRVVSCDSLETALANIKDDEYHLMIITSVGSDRIATLVKEARDHDVRTFSLDPAYVELGITIGIKAQTKGQLILVNLDSSREEGSRFSAHLLRLCQIVGDSD